MNLTFKGFLKIYLRELSEQQSLSLRKLVYLAETQNARLVEPLLVYSALNGSLDYLCELSQLSKFKKTFQGFANDLRQFESIEEYLQAPKTSPRMQKIWNAFQAKKTAADSSHRIVALMRPTILKRLEKKRISIYRMCKDLGINLGNAYAYLNAGNAAKISKASADRMLAYTEE